MNRCAVLLMLLAASVFALAQTTPSNSTYPPTQPQTIILPGTGIPGAVAGPSTNTGTAVIIAPPSAPLLVTPEVHLTTVTPTVGASNATAGNNAGAANATATLPVTPRVITTVPQYAGAESTITLTAPPEQTETAGPMAATGVSTTVTPAQGATTVIVSKPPEFNRGVGSSGAAAVAANTGGKSLAEAARQARQPEKAANARLYTNQDIERMNQQSGVQVGGMAGAAVGAGNATGAQQPSSGSMPAVAQPPTNPPANPGVSQPTEPTSKPPDQSQAMPPRNTSTQIAQASAPPSRADQMAPATPAPPPSQRLLPSAGSVLPVMALLGFLAAGAGLLAR